MNAPTRPDEASALGAFASQAWDATTSSVP